MPSILANNNVSSIFGSGKEVAAKFMPMPVKHEHLVRT
jgi:hypothetical protein